MFTGPNIVNDGLIFHYDIRNRIKSFKGEPTTNIITNTDLDTGWSKGYCDNIRWNDIKPPIGINSPVVSFHDKNDGSGYWFCYGDYAPQVPGETYTISIYVKTRDINFRIYAYTADNAEVGRVSTNTVTVPNDGKWHRVEFNPITNPTDSQSDSLSFKLYYGNPFGETQRTWLCAPQMEAKPYATPFTPNTRTATESLLDLTGNSIIDVSGTGFVNGQPEYNGTNTYSRIDNNFVGTVTELTTSVWFKRNGEGSNYECALHKSDNTTIGASDFWTGVDAGNFLTATIGASTGVGWAAGQTDEAVVNGKWYNLVATWDGSVVRVFVNGVFKKQYNLTTFNNIVQPTRIGASSDGAHYQFNGEVPIVKIYNKHQTDEEVRRNFRSYKSRFNLN